MSSALTSLWQFLRPEQDGEKDSRALRERAVAGIRYLIPLVVEGLLPVRQAKREALLETLSSAGTNDDPAAITAVLMMVYRRKNARYVSALLSQLGGCVEIRLWALDESDPCVERFTMGVGGGSKFQLINRLYDEGRIPEHAYIVIADDDVCFASGSLAQTINIARARHLGIFQPAHSWYSIYTYPLLLSRPWLQARSTGFVESGPLFIVSPLWRDQVFPLPEDIGMGWGVEVRWHRLRLDGCRLGVVDACKILHMSPVGRSYDSKASRKILESALSEEGMRSPFELMMTYEAWGALGYHRDRRRD
jgi:hypothetical protein